MVFNATFNYISVLSVVETGENHRPVVNHWQSLSHNVVSSTTCLSGIRSLIMESGVIDWILKKAFYKKKKNGIIISKNCLIYIYQQFIFCNFSKA